MSIAELKFEVGQLMAMVKLLCSPASPHDIKQQISECLSADLSTIENHERLDGIIQDNLSIVISKQTPSRGI